MFITKVKSNMTLLTLLISHAAKMHDILAPVRIPML